MKNTFGDRLRDLSHADRSYLATGALPIWIHNTLSDRQVVSLCAEFGTYDSVSVLRALREENAAHHASHADSPAFRRAKARLLEMFCPQSPAWRRSVWERGRELLQAALNQWPSTASD